MKLVFVRESDLEILGDAMTTALFKPAQPMTESEYLALGETLERIELFDGSLIVSPGPTIRHQHVSQRLAIELDSPADAAGLEVYLAVNVRLQTDRIFIPDLVITSDINYDELVADVDKIRLVCEVLSPSNAGTDTVTKMQCYATAGIPWYLIVEPATCVLRLYQLVDTNYVERSVTGPGEIFQLTDPVVAAIDPADLMRRR